MVSPDYSRIRWIRSYPPATAHPCAVAGFDAALAPLPFEKGKPSWLTAHTVKGMGVSFMEDTVACHYGSVDDAQLAPALAEIGAPPS